ncbi:MAG TPA: hypothetical protein VF132_03570, partial [Rudaea sp.]
MSAAIRTTNPTGAGELPLEMDPQVYRASNPDLGSLSDTAARAHYRKTGLDEGRRVSNVYNR